MAEFIYLHIPFCLRKCVYCDFFSVRHEAALEESYIDSLCAELSLRRDSAGSIRGVYLGGGTPSLLEAGSLTALFESLRQHYLILPDAEITIEANPATFDRSKVELFRRLGINRISLGVQSLRDEELGFLRRIHTADEAIGAAGMLKDLSLNYSVDLMYGIPGQSLRSWKDTLERVLALLPKHISTYELTPEGETPLAGLLGSGAAALPEEELVTEMYGFAIEFLHSFGYGQYEVSNFSLPGFECRHNLNYWNRGQYIGAGAGAHSFLGGVRLANTTDIEEYGRLVSKGREPEVSRSTPNHDDARREFLFLGLRKREGVSLTKSKEMGLEIVDSCRDLFDGGYLAEHDGYVRLTREGMVISNAVLVEMFGRLSL